MQFITNYWAQLTVILGIISYILKTIFDYKLKNKEIRLKYFYDIKSSKIIELYTKIVEIQMIIDRRKTGDAKTFEGNIFRNRIELDKYYWESEFYFSKKTQKSFKHFLEWLKYFESKELMAENPQIVNEFRKITDSLVKEFKSEVI